jgi:hypothetical protein
MSRNHFILHRGVRRPVALFATVVTSSVCYCSTTIAQSVASSAFITTNNVPSSHTTRRVAYCPYNSKKLFTLPWQQQRLYQQQQRNGMSTSSSSSSSLYDGSTNNQSLSNDDRDKISNENIFFIEVGFGNDSHGQVRLRYLHTNLHFMFFTHIFLRIKKKCQQQNQKPKYHLTLYISYLRCFFLYTILSMYDIVSDKGGNTCM